MNFFGIQIFPCKIKVNITMKSGKTFFFYCNKFSYVKGKHLKFDGGVSFNGSQLPGVDITVDFDCIECVEHKTVRLYRIYKK